VIRPQWFSAQVQAHATWLCLAMAASCMSWGNYCLLSLCSPTMNVDHSVPSRRPRRCPPDLPARATLRKSPSTQTESGSMLPIVAAVRRENTKSDPGAREIELNGLALWAIKRLIERAGKLGAARADHYLLPADLSRHTKSIDPLNGQRGYDPTRHQQSWRTAWLKMTQAAGLPHIHFHDLRHTAITRGREQGVAIGILKAIAGHMDSRMVEYYSHIGSGVKRDAVKLIGETYRPVAQLLGIEEDMPGDSVN
jgi:integrase